MRRVVSALAVASLTVGLVSVSPTASAGEGCPDPDRPVSDAYVPSQDVVLGPTGTAEIPFGMSGWDYCFHLFPPRIRVVTPSGEIPVDVTTTTDQVGYTSLTGTLVVDASKLSNAAAGEWVFDFDAGADRGTSRAVNVLRASRLSFDAGPEPLSHNRRLTFKGTLRAADWERGTYRGVRHQEVSVFAIDGQTLPTWEPLAVLQTTRHGRYRTRRQVAGPNRFQAVFLNHGGIAQAVSRIDVVAAGN